MKRYVTVWAVTHGNLINNKKINVYTLYLCVLCVGKMRIKTYKYGVFFMP